MSGDEEQLAGHRLNVALQIVEGVRVIRSPFVLAKGGELEYHPGRVLDEEECLTYHAALRYLRAALALPEAQPAAEDGG